MPVISVIVPVYNAEKYLRECLDSIVNQTYKNIEIILVDDGSTDGSGAICDEYADKDVRIKVYHIPNGGVSNARNLGIDNANGEYLMFVDSDDEVSRDCIEKLYCAIEYKEQDLVIGNFCDVYENRKIIQHENLSIIGNLQDDYANIRILLQGPWGKLYRSEILKKNKIRFRVDISLTEDQIFNYDFLKKASSRWRGSFLLPFAGNCAIIEQKRLCSLEQHFFRKEESFHGRIISAGCQSERHWHQAGGGSGKAGDPHSL